MIKSKNVNVGTILEVTKDVELWFTKPTRLETLKVGEQYEVEDIDKSSPIAMILKQVGGNGNKDGFQFFVYINKHTKVVNNEMMEVV